MYTDCLFFCLQKMKRAENEAEINFDKHDQQLFERSVAILLIIIQGSSPKKKI